LFVGYNNQEVNSITPYLFSATEEVLKIFMGVAEVVVI
jgi:hypothetical protein